MTLNIFIVCTYYKLPTSFAWLRWTLWIICASYMRPTVSITIHLLHAESSTHQRHLSEMHLDSAIIRASLNYQYQNVLLHTAQSVFFLLIESRTASEESAWYIYLWSDWLIFTIWLYIFGRFQYVSMRTHLITSSSSQIRLSFTVSYFSRPPKQHALRWMLRSSDEACARCARVPSRRIVKY